jgi:hypothetical protein
MVRNAGNEHLQSLVFIGEPSRYALHEVAPGGSPSAWIAIEEKGQGLHDMPGCLSRLRVSLGLKAAVALAEIVQKRDDGQALLGLHGEFGKPPSEIWPLEQGAKNGCDIEAMIDKGMLCPCVVTFSPRPSCHVGGAFVLTARIFSPLAQKASPRRYPKPESMVIKAEISPVSCLA